MSIIKLHRVFKASPEKIYKAFMDADAQAKWLPPHGFTCKVHHMDSKVGGHTKCLLRISRQEKAILSEASILR